MVRAWLASKTSGGKTNVWRFRWRRVRLGRVTVLEVIQRSTEFLARRGVESARLNAELLTAHVLVLPRLQLYLNFERTLTDPELDALRQLVKRRSEREPLQHLTGSTSFCGLEIKVSPCVLIPRPETEVLAERAWGFLGSWPDGAPTVLDFGTGSGCLAIALAVKCPSAALHALDISEEALVSARANAEVHGLAARIQFHLGDGLAALPGGLRAPGTFALLVSNPPYIPTGEIATLAPEVRDHDPRRALDGGEDGLDFYRRLAAETGPLLHPAGRIMLELGDGQAEAVRGLFEAGPWRVEAVENDLTGRARIFVAQPRQP